jgi:transposase
VVSVIYFSGMQGKKQFTEKLFISFQLSEQVPVDNFYRRLKDTLDLKFIHAATKHLYGSTGNPGIDAAVFFKLMLVGYLENITSDRRLIAHCSMRMDILYFLNYDLGEALPWHSTVSRTRQLYGAEFFEQLFTQVFAMCVAKGMVAGHSQAIDSAYVKANASMESIEKKQPTQSIGEHISKSENDNPAVQKNHLPQRKAKKNKASEEQQTITSSEQELNQLQTRNEYFKENKIEQHGNKVEKTFTSYSNQTYYSPTDPDARISTKPGKLRQLNYLCNMAVDTGQGVITHIQADYADKKDSRYLEDMATKTKQQLDNNNLQLENLLADTGYSSGINYHLMEQAGITAYIPTSGVFKHEREGFVYHKEEDWFTCRNNKKIIHKKTYTNTAGGQMKSYRSSRKDCRDCPFKKDCLGKKAQEKKFELSYYQEEYERAWNRQQTKHFKRMVRVRAGTVEPVFGNLINYYAMRKINVKGIEGAHKCMLMAATAFNLKKLMKFLNKKRTTKVMELHQEVFCFIKTAFNDLITSKISHPFFALQ